ncbi:hypothetical protein DFJ77DRAFT_259788 [Powellomyces hirtus]|nr:hypothetical protein DFJ77DRAFT_259788 [Powellomyces hirtus]
MTGEASYEQSKAISLTKTGWLGKRRLLVVLLLSDGVLECRASRERPGTHKQQTRLPGIQEERQSINQSICTIQSRCWVFEGRDVMFCVDTITLKVTLDRQGIRGGALKFTRTVELCVCHQMNSK